MTEQAPYEVVDRRGDVEIRRYGPLVLATVRGYDDESAFSLLFRYISGHNRTRRKISMTAPVVSSSEKISMTTPVVSSGSSFSFVMPEGYTVDSIPVPLDERVKIEAVPERHVAVLRFRGAWRPSTVEGMRRRLTDKVRSEGLSTEGEPFEMRYNPPFIPGFLRRNEVGMVVQHLNVEE